VRHLTSDVLYSPTAVILKIVGMIQVAGDFNLDGIVDMADYITWRRGLGTTYTAADYDVWLANYGQVATYGSGALSSAPAVPEPATFASALLAAICCFRRAMRSWLS
jgi:hypothetical protein